MIDKIQLDTWEKNGFLEINNILDPEDIKYLSKFYNDFLSGVYDTSNHRSDLGGKGKEGEEKITQIMRPSLLVPELAESKVYAKILQIAKSIIGEDAALDFDMLINKPPYTYSETPWHQDAAYWPPLPDKRSCSFWIALDNADIENGCMAYVAGSHLSEIKEHSKNENGALSTTLSDDDIITYGEIEAGDAIVHHGITLHYAGGNKSNRNRKAWIVNYRPLDMVSFMRSQGFNHLGERKNNS